MNRGIHRLVDRQVKTLGVGRHADGGGLYLIVEPSLSRRWAFIWTKAGKRRELGLGGVGKVSLATARRRAAEASERVGAGGNPIADRIAAQEAANQLAAEVQPFGEFADAWFENAVAPGLRNEKHRDTWRATLKNYCAPIRGKAIASIDTTDVLSILRPIWNSKTETASRIRGRIERVLDAAAVMGARSEKANPARWRGHLDQLLPRPTKLKRGHHPAMDWKDVPAFVGKLRERDAVTARALEFIILTAARAGEALGARWAEIDLTTAVWTVPASRMKRGREHRVPLTTAALEILEAVRPLTGGEPTALLFPGHTKRPMGPEALEMLRRRMGAGEYTTHGFRSSFRDWAGEATDAPREVAEGCLAHETGNAVERAYRRADALEKRRSLLQSWANFCEAPEMPNSVGNRALAHG
jgi:integrase